MLVIKPAFPAVVYTIPYCCNTAANVRTIPLIRPATQIEPLFTLISYCFFVRKITGISVIAPKRNLMPVNAKGPISCIPAFWATKAKPQIIAVNSSSTSVVYLDSERLIYNVWQIFYEIIFSKWIIDLEFNNNSKIEPLIYVIS